MSKYGHYDDDKYHVLFSTTPQCADWSQVLSKDFSSWSSVCRQNKTKTKPGHYLTKWTSYWKKLTIDAKNTTVHQTNSKTSFHCRSLDVQRATEVMMVLFGQSPNN